MEKSELIKKYRKIKLVLTDVDGVLTDGCMYYSSKGEELKKFHTRDGMAVELLLQNNIKTIIVTREKSKIVVSRAQKIKIFKETAYLLGQNVHFVFKISEIFKLF